MQEINISDSAKRWIDRRLSPSIHLCSIGDLQKQVEDTPEFWTNDIDESYRQGFEEGFDYCITQFEEMYRKKGFARVREIVNILRQWSGSVLRRWRVYGKGRYRDYANHHPEFRQLETWGDIRDYVLRRDRACVRCGDVLKLEVDHIIDVQHGGLPRHDNLRVLCRKCHKTKHLWTEPDNVVCGLSDLGGPKDPEEPTPEEHKDMAWEDLNSYFSSHSNRQESYWFHGFVQDIKPFHEPYSDNAVEGFTVRMVSLEKNKNIAFEFLFIDGESITLAFLVATNILSPQQLSGGQVSYSKQDAMNHQLCFKVKLGVPDEKNRKWPEIDGLHIYHIDDPRSVVVEKNERALEVTPPIFRRPASFFGPLLNGII